MLTSVIDQMPTVLVETVRNSSQLPPEDIDTHRMLSTTALKIARIDEPIYFREWYDESDGQYWGHLEAVYHHDHAIRWSEIDDALRYDWLTGGLSLFPPRDCWDGSLRLDTRYIRINFTPTVRR